MGLFTNILEGLVDFVQTDPYLHDAPAIPVSHIQDKSKMKVLRATIDKMKLGVVFMFSSAKTSHANTPGPYFDLIYIEAHVAENRNINDTGRDCEEVAARLAQIVIDYREEGICEDFVFDTIEPIAMPKEFEHLAALNVKFQTAGAERYKPDVVETPIIAFAGGEATMSSATAGASIYFTLDGSRPTDRTGTLYFAPVAVAAGTTVKARAYKAGLRASAIATAIAPSGAGSQFVDPEGGTFVDPESGGAFIDQD